MVRDLCYFCSVILLSIVACDPFCASGCDAQGADECDSSCLITHTFDLSTHTCKSTLTYSAAVYILPPVSF